MNDNSERNYMSVGHWMWLIFLTAIPCVGVILILVFACVGENETRKNYFRALIAWFLIIVAIGVTLAVLSNAGQIHLPFNLKPAVKQSV